MSPPLFFSKLYGSDNDCLSAEIKAYGQESFASDMCPPECAEVVYETDVSASKWPGEHFWAEMAKYSAITYNGN